MYGVVGDELYWFFRSTPDDRNRGGFGTPRFDVAGTNVWSFAVLRDGTVDVIGRYQSLFSGAVLISDLVRRRTARCMWRSADFAKA